MKPRLECLRRQIFVFKNLSFGLKHGFFFGKNLSFGRIYGSKKTNICLRKHSIKSSSLITYRSTKTVGTRTTEGNRYKTEYIRVLVKALSVKTVAFEDRKLSI